MAKEKICGIYCIENLVNHKKYIGLSVNIYKRWGDHKYALNNQKHANPYLQRAWNKYGKENFKFWIVEACNQVNLHDKEIYYIELYNTTNENYGYNCSCGGEITSTREDTLEKRSITLSKRKVVQVDFDGNIVSFSPDKFINITHGYAISVHKSQGGEFNMVIIPFVNSFKRMLYNKLIYTAVTRAKSKLILIGSREAFVYGVNNDYVNNRKTTLKEMLIKKYDYQRSR